MCERFAEAETRFRLSDDIAYCKWLPKTIVEQPPVEVVAGIVNKLHAVRAAKVSVDPSLVGTNMQEFVPPTQPNAAAMSDAHLHSILTPFEAGNDLIKHQQAFAEGTRNWVFKALEECVKLPTNHKDRRVFWVQGTGGLGKSVIAGQIVKRYYQNDGGAFKLAAYYFCKHDDTARNEPRRVVATLAYWIAMAVPEYKNLVLQLLEKKKLESTKDDKQEEQTRSLTLSDLLNGAGTFDECTPSYWQNPCPRLLKCDKNKETIKTFSYWWMLLMNYMQDQASFNYYN